MSWQGTPHTLQGHRGRQKYHITSGQDFDTLSSFFWNVKHDDLQDTNVF